LLDLNVLVALTEPEHVHHRRAEDWFNTSGKEDWGVCPLTEAGFVRVTTNPSYRPVPRSMEQAIAILQMIKEYPGYSFWKIEESWTTLTAPFTARIFGHQQVTDAYLLGLAIKNDGVLVTFDEAILKLAGSMFNKNVRVLN
jgi:toxin-antitoxin system PIN domain toxin